MSYTDEEIYAILAEVSYQKTNEERRELLHDHYGLVDYVVDENLSGENSAVILTPDGDTVISYRGTDVHNISDLVADVNIALGFQHFNLTKPARFQEAEETYLKTKEKYPYRPIKVSSHSLGASQGLMIAKKFGLEGFHFNIGASVMDSALQLKNFLKCSGNGDSSCQILKKQNFYTTAKDPISISMLPRLTNMFGKENVNFVQPKKKLDLFNHSLAHFLPDVSSSPIREKDKMKNPIKYKIFETETNLFCRDFPNDFRCSHLKN